MSYANRDTFVVTLPGVNFATGRDGTIRLPKGKRGRLLEVTVLGTTLFTAVTTEGKLNIGSATDADAYASCGMGTLAAKACYSATNNAGDIISADLPADTDIKYATVAPTGGSPAGVGDIIITFGIY